MKLLFASQNTHKRIEMAALLPEHEIIMPKDVGIDFDFEETADSFIGNALGKAEHLFKLTGLPSFADDSGIAVDALDGKPGIYSARYGSDVFGRMLDAPERNRYLLENLQGIEPDKRSARFICAIALVLSPARIYVIQETVEGSVAERPFGNGGFGYDPIFLVGDSGRTMAELSEQEKNRISHRGNASARLRLLLADIEHKEIVHVC
jgi:XTP/dITP diphosphohydrolase